MPVSSPCIGLCVIDDTAGYCRGCGRSLAEIAVWSALCEPERQAVMATLQQRLENAGPGEARPLSKPDQS